MDVEFLQGEARILQEDSMDCDSEVCIIKEEDDEVIIIEDEEEKSASEFSQSELLQNEKESSIETPDKTETSKSFSSSFIKIASKNFICDICNETFISFKAYESHKHRHNRNQTFFACNTCDFGCLRLADLVVHSRHHNHGSFKYSCNSCDFQCNDNLDYRRHEITHATSELFACIKCNFQCNQSFSWQLHMNVVHGKPLRCDLCQFTCDSLDQLNSHRSKYGETACLRCDFKCHSSVLNAHMEIKHSNTVPYNTTMHDHEQLIHASLINNADPDNTTMHDDEQLINNADPDNTTMHDDVQLINNADPDNTTMHDDEQLINNADPDNTTMHNDEQPINNADPDNDENEPCILSDIIQPVHDHSILPESSNSMPRSVDNDSNSCNSPVITNVKSIAQTNVQQFNSHIVPYLNNTVASVPNNLNTNMSLFVDPQNNLYRIDKTLNILQPIQLYIFTSSKANLNINNRGNSSVMNHTHPTDQLVNPVSSDPLERNTIYPEITVNKDKKPNEEVIIIPKRRSESANKRKRIKKKSQQLSLPLRRSSTTVQLLGKDKESVEDAIQQIAVKRGVVNEALSDYKTDSIKKKGKPDYQCAFADFLQHNHR